MRNGELDRLDPGKISCVQNMLATGPGLGFLAEHIGQGVGHRVQCRHRRQTQMPALAFKLCPDIPVDDGEYHQARIFGHFAQNPVEMLFRADHGPEMLDDLHPVELGERGLGDIFQGLAG